MAIGKKTKLLLGGVLLLLLLAAGATGFYLWNKPPEKVESRKGIRLSAEALCRAFTQNETKANELYLNKAIRVRGTIANVIRNLDGGILLVLEGCDEQTAVQCGMRERRGSFQKGDIVVVKGFCAGKTLTGITLTGCIVMPGQ